MHPARHAFYPHEASAGSAEENPSFPSLAPFPEGHRRRRRVKLVFDYRRLDGTHLAGPVPNARICCQEMVDAPQGHGT